MDAAESFRELLRRVREGDQAAAAELVQQYEPEIRRAVRMRLTNPRLRRIYDSFDISQSVLANFWVRYIESDFDLTHPDQLVRLLVTMIRNKIANREQRTDLAESAESGVLEALVGREDSPSQVVARAELFLAIQGQLTAEERRIGELRAGGLEWGQIAAEVGGTADGVRKKLGKAFDRICCRFELDGMSYAPTA